jgi:Lon protease-like protein
MPDRLVRDFPLFPLPIVALPTESVPLHVFEDRYRRMIEECLLTEREFGIVWRSEDELKQVGCACEIEEVLEPKDDGRLNILARGTRPFRLIQRQDDLHYPAGVIELLTDEEESPDAEAAQAARQLEDDDLEAMDAYRMAATVEFGPDAKQELIELRSENARLRLLALLLRAAIKRLELVDRAQARARSNGKVRFG